MSQLEAVRLDMSKLPDGEYQKHALLIAESLLNICGLEKVWDEPEHGHRVFYVREVPDDIPQAGIHWLQVAVTRFQNKWVEP